jgi:hypothetical protein
MNHLIEFEEPINKPTHRTTCGPTNDLSIDLWQCQMEIDEMNSKKKTQPHGLCQDKNQSKLHSANKKRMQSFHITICQSTLNELQLSMPYPLITILLPHSSWLPYQSQASTQQVYSRFLREHLNHLMGPWHSQQS